MTTSPEENKNNQEEEETLALIKPDSFHRADEIIARILKEGFTVVERKQLRLTKVRAEEFYAEHKGRSFFDELVSFMTSGSIYALKLRGPGAILGWRSLMGPTRREQALKEAPNSIRALFGTDTTQNAAHGSDSQKSAQRELSFFFDTEQTLALIKPDAMEKGHAPAIIARIESEGFLIVERRQFTLSRELAEEFYAEHQGRSFFPELLEMMTRGDIIALRLERNNAISGWRSLMGPTRREQALKEAPNSIRGLYATDTTQNAAHGSDSVSAAARELGLIFPPQVTLALIKPDVVRQGSEVLSKVFARVTQEQFTIRSCRRLRLTKEQAEQFYAEHKERSFFQELVTFMTSGDIYALKLQRRDAIAHWRRVIGPTRNAEAKQQAPNSLRALFGTDNTQNGFHGSDSEESARRELAFYFGSQFLADQEQTLAMLKPDVCRKEDKSGQILDRILYEGFEVVQMEQLQLTKERAQAFYKEHEGRSFYDELVTFMTSGPVIALRLQRNNAILGWRAVMGPTRLAEAKQQAPNSLRALFATDTTQNACHGSDSAESAQRELAFFFST